MLSKPLRVGRLIECNLKPRSAELSVCRVNSCRATAVAYAIKLPGFPIIAHRSRRAPLATPSEPSCLLGSDRNRDPCRRGTLTAA
jgi:hypothetical protein